MLQSIYNHLFLLRSNLILHIVFILRLMTALPHRKSVLPLYLSNIQSMHFDSELIQNILFDILISRSGKRVIIDQILSIYFNLSELLALVGQETNRLHMKALFDLLKMDLIPPDEVHLMPDLFVKSR